MVGTLTFEPTGVGNYVMHGDGFAISFRPYSSGSLGADTQLGETALCKSDGSHLILNGDFRVEYHNAVSMENTFKSALVVFNKHKAECQSSWSNGEESL